MISAIDCVHAGGTYVQPAVTENILMGVASINSDYAILAEPEGLSPKELEILRYLAGGYSNREIAQVIRKSEGTIKNQVSAILVKLGLRDRMRAVSRGIELGLPGT